MASHRADSSRTHRDDRGGRYSAPRGDDRRDRDRDTYRGEYRDRRDDRHDVRRRDDRDRDRDRDRDVRRRDDRRERDTYRRSRSPPLRRRSRDRYTDDRRYSRDDRYNGRDTGRRNSGEYGRLNDSRRNSNDHAADVRPVSRSSNLSREDKRRDEEVDPKRAEEEKRVRLQKRAEAWALKRKEQKQLDSPAAAASPTTAPATPGAASTMPPASDGKLAADNSKVSAKPATESKPTQVKEFRLDASAAARPAQFKAATAKSNGLVATNRANGQTSKTNGNIGAFGLKGKSIREDAVPEPTKGLLDDGENTAEIGKRSLQVLPVFTPIDGEGASPIDDVVSPIGDIGDDDETVRAHLEKRREELANETKMEEVPAAADASGEKMDVDDDAGAQEDEVDPLDAFMANLSDAVPKKRHRPGQAMFSDELEPVETAVEEEDLMALTKAKKKKKNDMPKVEHDKVEYQPFRKNFYTEPAEVTAMTANEVADLRLELDGIKVKDTMVTKGEDDKLPRPVVKWAQMGLLQPTMDALAAEKFVKPTPIQAQAIPIIESGRNFIGIAKTGSGKTLAFGIPMIRHIIDQPPLKPSDGPIALILAPTRELAGQIVSELKGFLKPSKLHIASACGGVPISDQIAMIKRGGVHVLCATPGRLIELLGSNGGRVLNLKRITYVVLDEADRMFDMGFEPQVVKILDNVRPDRQSILFSATFPKNMAALARKALQDYAEVIIGGRSVVASDVTQVVKLINKKADKFKELLSTLGQLFLDDENAQVLIFVERQETAEELLHMLIKAKYNDVNTIHGAKDQTDRSEAINNFKQGQLAILIATSVAARGLDVPNLAMVFNYDCPTHLEDYVHRCGRTGRAGNKGTAVTLVENPGEEHLAYYVLKALTQSGYEPLPELKKMSEEYHKKIKSGEVKIFTGFGGSGLDKLDASRANEKRREKRALRVANGEEASDDEEELPAAKKPAVAGKEGDAEDIPAYMKILNSSISVSKTERPEPEPTKPMTAKERAMAAATKVDGRLSKKGMIHHGQPIDNKGPDAGLFHATVVINDFPQEARWAVTNRTNVVKVLDQTGVSITSKGTYHEPGRSPPPDADPANAKLYLLVEGDTENAVSTAMRELYQYLVSGVKIHNERAGGPQKATGRYKID